MDDTQARVARVLRAAHERVRAREIRLRRGLSALCAGLGLALTGAMAHFGGTSPGNIQGMQGAALLQDSAGGYVLVGVLSFAAASALTLTCVRLQERAAWRRKKKEEEIRS